MGEFYTIRSEPKLPAYVGIPSDEEAIPAVIVFMHKPGVDKAMEKVVDDLVAAGLVGICFDIYRDGTLIENFTDKSVFEDFEATFEYIKRNIPIVDDNRIGVMGFCMGGRYAYLAAARYSEKLKAVVSYYGFPTRGQDERSTPINLVEEMTCPVLGIFGKLDHLYPFSDVEKFRDHLLTFSPQVGKHTILVYEDVGHGFLNPFSPRHGDGHSANQAWNETIAFYKKYL